MLQSTAADGSAYYTVFTCRDYCYVIPDTKINTSPHSIQFNKRSIELTVNNIVKIHSVHSHRDLMETCSLSWIGGYNIYYLWYLIQDATAVNTHNSARQQLEHYLQNQFPLKTTLTVTQHLFSYYENNHNIHNITLQSNDKACILSKSVTKHCKQSNQNIRTTGC